MMSPHHLHIARPKYLSLQQSARLVSYHSIHIRARTGPVKNGTLARSMLCRVAV
jgi:hypothetical protein